MRCASCDKILSTFESTRKYEGTTKYVDLCNHCFATIADVVPVVERADLVGENDEECS